MNKDLLDIQNSVASITNSIPKVQTALDTLTVPYLWSDQQNRSVLEWHQICDAPCNGFHKDATLSQLNDRRLNVSWYQQQRNMSLCKSWDNLYIWCTNPATACTFFVFDIGVIFSDLNSIKNLNAFEHEIHMCKAGFIYNGGVQFRLAENNLVVRIYDYKNAQWIDTRIPILTTDFTAGIETHIRVLYKFDLGVQNFIGLSINGRNYNINMSFPCVSTTESERINFAFQLDGKNLDNAFIHCTVRLDVVGI